MTDVQANGWASVASPSIAQGPALSLVGPRAFVHSSPDGRLSGVHLGGFYVADVRFASALDLRVDGRRPVFVDAQAVQTDEAIICSVVDINGAGVAQDAPITVVRYRTQRDGLRERIVIFNYSREHLSCELSVTVDADYATVLGLLLGPEEKGTVSWSGDGDSITASSTDEDGVRLETRFRLPGGSADGGRRLRTSVEVPAGGHAEVQLDVLAVVTARSGDPEDREGDETRRQSPSRAMLHSSADALGHLWEQGGRDLELLRMMIGAKTIVGAGVPSYMTLFGRDSIITCLQSMLIDARGALHTAQLLAKLQGAVDDRDSGEQPGKILHEVRFTHDLRFYETVDATPLFIRLVCELPRWGTSRPEVVELLPSVRAAVGWIEQALAEGDGFSVYRAHGRLAHHGWKDSATAIVDADGEPVSGTIAVIEAQGYATAALRAAAELERRYGESSRAPGLLQEANQLQERIAKAFWIADEGYFAAALADGRQIRSVTSNQGHLLWAGALDAQLAASVASRLTAPDLFTGWGVRTLSATNPAYNPLSYHLGSVWPHDTAICIAGLLRYGHDDQALQLAEGVLAAAPFLGYRLPELFAGFPRDELPFPVRYPYSSAPQAWSASAAISLTKHLLGINPRLDEGRVILAPRLPAGMTVELRDCPLGDGRFSLRVEGRRVVAAEAPPGVELVEGGRDVAEEL